ncbi:uncharacterized protein BDZ99DRAFT_516987 [Mytilinidion resinicola]|uniref:Uncharacterized protein n=1 Tax=Mytilinidion resinicola TaxID=574789 RepID=A0A6A6Z118_9PEZI|nr:uncharacterized protein BDZ99DRAFT_516987 [Mytilinidion resinicola]KAF2814393.1 hypothetical protein BDZ99DRAFT_516987 [Mytilinidion resinicola]
MDTAAAIAISSLVIAILALWAAIAQVNIQASVEARRKGKTDKLALGEWAIKWPQTKAFVFKALSIIYLPSPFGDPQVLAVPFITVGALEDCFRHEQARSKRGAIERRIKRRLVKSATQAITTGGGRFTGRMYAVRSTTRKRSEACWADAMDMCGITRKDWPLMTGASALACDGAIRPASAVTNLHSLWGFARVMDLRTVEIKGTRITMTNGGASIYLDQYAGVDRPTKLAHFSGSPNGRYSIVEEMSQHTGESIYADAVWSDGFVPLPSRLEPNHAAVAIKAVGKRRVIWPSSIKVPMLDRNDPASDEKFSSWASQFLADYGICQFSPNRVSYAQLIETDEPAVISCIRTYPRGELSPEQVEASVAALSWCMDHWWRDQYQMSQRQQNESTIPRLPIADINQISSEFVTGRAQAWKWCDAFRTSKSVQVESDCWKHCVTYVEQHKSGHNTKSTLRHGERAVLVKVFQTWKLYTTCDRLHKRGNPRDIDTSVRAAAICEIMLLSMALLAIATDSSQIGSSEVNKALEIELS